MGIKHNNNIILVSRVLRGWGSGDPMSNFLRGGGIDIFWNHTLCY